MATTSQAGRDPTFRELLVDLGQDVAALLHDEVDLAKKETRSELRTAILLLGVVGVLSVTSMLTVCAAAVIALSRVLDPAWAALAVGGALAAIAVIFILVARAWRRRTDIRPQLTIDGWKEDQPWAKELKFR